MLCNQVPLLIEERKENVLLSYLVTHYYHSGFSVSCDDSILIFDYWLGEHQELTPKVRLTKEILEQYRHIYVFISHDHPDHMDPVVFTWKDLPGIQYIVSSDMPVGTRGRRMAPGSTICFSEDVEVTAFDSTDLGVSFMVNFKGLQVFHAGDLNFWHWRDESGMKEIEEADNEFRKAVAPICGRNVDLAFFPLDPRQGTMFEAGANYFILSVKPRIMIPMHYFHRAEVAMEYARTASCRTTEVIALPGYGDLLNIELDEEGYLNLSFPARPELREGEDRTNDGRKTDDETVLGENDPFRESDLPLTQLMHDDAENNPQEETAPEA
jgi:L-ascorbate metabolism protein UlaG (beta-lactamase superfamily)